MRDEPLVRGRGEEREKDQHLGGDDYKKVGRYSIIAPAVEKIIPPDDGRHGTEHRGLQKTPERLFRWSDL